MTHQHGSNRVDMPDAVGVVRAWHMALNDGDLERLVALSTADVEVGGPRGVGRGADLLREWFARAGVRIEPHQMYRRDQTVVVAQRATWSATGGGGTSVGQAPGTTGARMPGPAQGVGQAGDVQGGEPQAVASVFVVRQGEVARVVRYPDVASALEAAGLTSADAV